MTIVIESNDLKVKQQEKAQSTFRTQRNICEEISALSLGYTIAK